MPTSLFAVARAPALASGTFGGVTATGTGFGGECGFVVVCKAPITAFAFSVVS